MQLQAEVLETLVWQGDTTSGNANLDKIDGFAKLITVANGAIDFNDAAKPAIDSTNAVFEPYCEPNW